MYTIPPEKYRQATSQKERRSGKEKNMRRYELKAPDKKTLVKRIGELTGQKPRYTYMPRCSYEIGVYTVERNGDLVVDEAEVDEELIRTLYFEGLITEDHREEDHMEDETISAETTEAAENADTAEPDNLTISLPMARHTADSLRRLVNLLYSRGPLLSKATSGQFGVKKELIAALDEAGTVCRTDDFIELVKEHGGLIGLSFADDKVSFTGFPLTDDPEKNTAFQQIACLMNKHALEQKRIQAKAVNGDNEKYAFRIWLLRLGMNGDEYKASRKILMENLSGHSAFRTQDEETRWKVRQKEKREALKAAKAAVTADETPADAV